MSRLFRRLRQLSGTRVILARNVDNLCPDEGQADRQGFTIRMAALSRVRDQLRWLTIDLRCIDRDLFEGCLHLEERRDVS